MFDLHSFCFEYVSSNLNQQNCTKYGHDLPIDQKQQTIKHLMTKNSYAVFFKKKKSGTYLVLIFFIFSNKS